MGWPLNLQYKSQKNATQYNAISGLLGTLGITGTYTLDGTDIDLRSGVRAKLGASENGLSTLCTHDNVNEWSIFKPNGNTPYNFGSISL